MTTILSSDDFGKLSHRVLEDMSFEEALDYAIQELPLENIYYGETNDDD